MPGVLTVGYLVLHLMVVPMRDPLSQGLQSTLLSCLVGVAVSGAPFAITLETAAPSPTGSPSTPVDGVARQLQTVCGIVAPALATVWAFRPALHPLAALLRRFVQP